LHHPTGHWSNRIASPPIVLPFALHHPTLLYCIPLPFSSLPLHCVASPNPSLALSYCILRPLSSLPRCITQPVASLTVLHPPSIILPATLHHPTDYWSNPIASPAHRSPCRAALHHPTRRWPYRIASPVNHPPCYVASPNRLLVEPYCISRPPPSLPCRVASPNPSLVEPYCIPRQSSSLPPCRIASPNPLLIGSPSHHPVFHPPPLPRCVTQPVAGLTVLHLLSCNIGSPSPFVWFLVLHPPPVLPSTHPLPVLNHLPVIRPNALQPIIFMPLRSMLYHFLNTLFFTYRSKSNSWGRPM
jgi:hypothetical protein